MLDSFLKVAYANEKRDEEQAQLVEKMASLPEDLLHKIVSGEEKLAYIGSFSDENWIEKYKGTPLFEQAIELEKQELQARMAESARRTEDSEKFRAQDAARDELCIQKKLLDLQLLEQEAGVGQGEEVPEEGVPGEEPPPEEGGPPMEEEAPEEVPAEEPPVEEAPPAAAAPEAPPAAPPKVDVKVASAAMRMALFKQAAGRELSGGEGVGSFYLGGVPGYLGAKKAVESGKGTAFSGGARGVAGSTGGLIAGGLGGASAGSALSKVVPSKYRGAAHLGGAALGAVGGAVGGYKALTAKYNTPKEKKASAKKAEALPWQAGVLMGVGLGALSTPSMVVSGATNERDSDSFFSRRGALRGAAGAAGATVGGAVGGGIGALASGLPGRTGALAPVVGTLLGGTLGAYLGGEQVPTKEKKASAKIAKERTVGERTLGGLAGGAGGSLLGKGMERIYDAGQMRPGTLGGALPLMGAGAGLLYGARKGKGDKEKKAEGRFLKTGGSAAGLLPAAVLGAAGYMGHSAGKAQARRGEDAPEWGVGKYLGSGLVLPYGAYQVGRSIGHNKQTEDDYNKEKTKKAEALFKEALGLGMLAKAVGGAAKRVAKPAMNAAMGAGGVGAGAQMAAKTIGATAPGALKTVGRAAKSYAKSNPLQAAGLAGGAGLATGAALS